MIVDQVLPGNAEVHRVPESEFFPHPLQQILRDLGVGHLTIEVDEVPDLVVQVLWFNRTQRASTLAVQGLVLQEVAHRVIRHVDRTVGQGFDEELLVPRDFRAEAERSAASPLLQPRDGVPKRLLDPRVVSLEIAAVQVVLNLLLPRLLAILEVPLVDRGDNALVTAAPDDLLLRLGVKECLAVGDHLVPEGKLGLLDGSALEGAVRHDALIEPKFVAGIMCLLQLLLVLLRLHPQLLAHVLSGHGADLAVDLDIDDGHELERLDPLRLDAEVLALPGLHEVHKSGVIVGRIAWHARDDACALVHLDGQQGEQMADVIRGGGALDLATHQVLAGNLLDEFHLPPSVEDVLEAHVPRGAMGGDVHLVILGFVTAVLALRQDPAIRLAGHRLGSQGRGQQVNLLAFELLHALGQLEQLDLDSCVLLGANAFALGAVVVHARLPVRLRIDGRAFAEADLVAGLQLPELPADE
mmetsp:Transcript_21945/g.62701  ORF Transcript_21945/g.62701 Transcript_21945/m.62701 type:complete len:469 (+) Transcript_21945:1730-3136(+)